MESNDGLTLGERNEAALFAIARVARTIKLVKQIMPLATARQLAAVLTFHHNMPGPRELKLLKKAVGEDNAKAILAILKTDDRKAKCDFMPDMITAQECAADAIRRLKA